MASPSHPRRLSGISLPFASLLGDATEWRPGEAAALRCRTQRIAADAFVGSFGQNVQIQVKYIPLFIGLYRGITALSERVFPNPPNITTTRVCAPAPSSCRAARLYATPAGRGGAHRWELFGRTHAGRRRRSPHGTRIRRSCRYSACETIRMSPIRPAGGRGDAATGSPSGRRRRS